MHRPNNSHHILWGRPGEGGNRLQHEELQIHCDCERSFEDPSGSSNFVNDSDIFQLVPSCQVPRRLDKDQNHWQNILLLVILLV